jgi:hypothetical protein
MVTRAVGIDVRVAITASTWRSGGGEAALTLDLAVRGVCRARVWRGEPIVAVSAAQLDHAGQRLPRLRIDLPRRSFLARKSASEHSLLQLPLVHEHLPSFDLPLRPQAMAALSAANCLSRLANPSRSISGMDRTSIRSRSTGLRYLGIS